MRLVYGDKNKLSIFELLTKYRIPLMGFAALWIFLFHGWNLIFTEYRLLSLGERFVRRIGFCGVDIFLLLSGIGMVYSWENSKSVCDFYLKRIKRILFPFIVVAVFRCCIEHWTFLTFIKNISGINFYTQNILSFLWFVPAIATFYLIFPIYYRLFMKSSNKCIFTLCVLMVWLLISLGMRETPRQDIYGFSNRIPIFLNGVLAGWASKYKKIEFDKLTWQFMCILFLLGLYLSYLTNYRDLYLLVPTSNCCIPNIFISISLSCLMVAFFDMISQKHFIKKIGIGLIKVLSFYGTVTLELYCVQEWIGGMIKDELIDRYPALLINIILLFVLSGAAFVMHLAAKYFWKLEGYIIHKMISKHNYL